MLKYLSLLCVVLFLGCAGQKSVPTPKPNYPWETLPDDERRLYEGSYQCPVATVRINEVIGWETVEILDVEPPTYDMKGQVRTVIDPNDSEKDFSLFYVYLPRGLTLLYGFDHATDIAYIDYFAFQADIDETKATGEFFCQAETAEP